MDNFFDDETIGKIKNYLKNADYKSNCYTRPNIDITTDIPFFRKDLTNDDFFSVYLRDIIYYNMKIKNKLNRVYIIVQSYAQYSNYHFDSQRGITVCLYVNEYTTEESGGHIFFKIPDKTHILKIEPKYNRLVMFPANYIHRGSGFNDATIRYCISWKFDGDELYNKE